MSNRREFIVATRRGLVALGGALVIAAASPQARAAANGGLSKLRETPEGRPIPADLIFFDAEGRETSFDAFLGRGLVVNFWATWCPPCVAEMPSLDRAQVLLESEDITVLPLSSDRGGRAQVEPFYARLRLGKLGIWLDRRGAVGRALGIRGLPSTILLNRAGREVARLEGEAEWDHPALLAAVRRLAGAGTAAPDR